MTPQQTVDLLAKLANPRMAMLLRLSTAKHVYDPTPGELNSQSKQDGVVVTLDREKRVRQPYADLNRFLNDERIMGTVVDPGLLPIAKAISVDVRGHRLLVTRKSAPRKGDRGAIAHLAAYGIRVVLNRDEDSAETTVDWECLYGLA